LLWKANSLAQCTDHEQTTNLNLRNWKPGQGQSSLAIPA